MVEDLEDLKEENARLKREVEGLRSGIVNDKRLRRELSKSNVLSSIVLGLLKLFDTSGRISNLYTKFWPVINYVIVAGIGGVLVNYLILSTFITILPLFFANILAIAIASLWNYALTVGPFGYLTGLVSKKGGEKADGTW